MDVEKRGKVLEGGRAQIAGWEGSGSPREVRVLEWEAPDLSAVSRSQGWRSKAVSGLPSPLGC